MVELNWTWWVVVWLAAAGATVLVWWRRRSTGSGLVIAYLVSLWMIHWLGGAIQLSPAASDGLRDPATVFAGFVQSTYAVVAFAVGSIWVAPRLLPSIRQQPPQAVRPAGAKQIAYVYVMIGVASYPLLSTFIGQLPSVQAVIAVSQYLLIVGACLLCWDAWKKSDGRRFWIVLGATLLFPLVTLITRGFLGYGVYAIMYVLAFVAAFYRPRWRLVVAALVLGYLGLSLYTGYMQERTLVRAAVWGGRSFDARMATIGTTLAQADWFDPGNPLHLELVDGRLNQNYFVGTAVEHIKTSGHFARGETLWQALIAVIPRAIWPSKPVVAGSMDLVATYTGLRLAEGTSFGIGQVMEFYVNFGTVGVFSGFLVLGTLVTYVDQRAGRYLRRGDWPRFALWFLPGLSLLNVGGSLVELTSGAAASIVAVWGINRFILPYVVNRQAGTK